MVINSFYFPRQKLVSWSVKADRLSTMLLSKGPLYLAAVSDFSILGRIAE